MEERVERFEVEEKDVKERPAETPSAPKAAFPPTCPYCERPILAVRQMTPAYRRLVRHADGSWHQDGEVWFDYPDTDVFRHDGEGGCQTVLNWLDWHEDSDDAEDIEEPEWLWPTAVKP